MLRLRPIARLALPAFVLAGLSAPGAMAQSAPGVAAQSTPAAAAQSAPAAAAQSAPPLRLVRSGPRRVDPPRGPPRPRPSSPRRGGKLMQARGKMIQTMTTKQEEAYG